MLMDLLMRWDLLMLMGIPTRKGSAKHSDLTMGWCCLKHSHLVTEKRLERLTPMEISKQKEIVRKKDL